MTFISSLLGILLFQLCYHIGICQGGGISQRSSIGDVTEQSAHDLTAAGLWQFRGKENLIGSGNGSDLFCNMALKFIDKRVASVDTGFQRNKSADRLAFDIMCFADDGGFSDFLMIHESAFNLHGTDPMAGDIHDVIDAAQ